MSDTPSPRPLPGSCDVLVVGAGPAGSAAAQWLARAGWHTVLVDQHDFPRDKICGDGLIPDTHAALKRLGVLDEVLAQAEPVTDVRFVAPRGSHVDIPGTLCVLPRKVLDHILVRAAQRAGAQLHTPWRMDSVIEEDGRVVGARFKPGAAAAAGAEANSAERHELRARWVVLATGAVPQALMAAGLCDRRTPSGVALRGYVRNEGLGQRQPAMRRQLHMVWHPRLRGGYGWIFPAPGGLFNIGAGMTGSHLPVRPGQPRVQDVNLREMFQAFCEVYPPAAELMQTGELQGEIKGAPLRCSLIGGRWSRPGLLATGEAVGSTYALSGEGIGKAMETGILAAEALLHDAAAPDADVQQRYEDALRGLKPQFDLYEKASHVNNHPWIADLVVWRARRSERIRRRLTGVLEETQNPGRLFSLRGLSKLFTE